MEFKQIVISFVCVSAIFMLHSQGQWCSSRTCQPPDCSCPTFKHNLNPKEIPQMVYFGFDDAVNVVMASLYDRIFTEKRKNPNGCRMKFTLFVSNRYTDYRKVKKFYDKGMEIAVHSVTHRAIDNDRKLRREAKKQKENLVRAGVAEEDIKGWRSPFLKPAGNNQPKILKELGYEYDISLTYTRMRSSNPKPWPFTMHNGWPYRCGVPPCPLSARVPQFWEVPVVSLMDYKQDYPCSFVDGCAIAATNEDEAFKYLMDNFLSYYNTTRAPFGLNMHAAWFYTRFNLKAMMRFLDALQKMDDVYVITVKQVIDWMKQPTTLSNIENMKSWSCPEATPVRRPTTPTTAKTTTSTTTKSTTTTPTTTSPSTTTPTTTTSTTTTPTTTTPTTTTPTTTTPTTTTPTTTTPTTTTTTTPPTTTTPTTTTPTTTTPTTTTPTTTTQTTTTPTTTIPTTTTPTTTTPTTTTSSSTTPKTTKSTTTTPKTTTPTTTTSTATTPITTTQTTTTLTTTTPTTTTPTTTTSTTTTPTTTTPTTTTPATTIPTTNTSTTLTTTTRRTTTPTKPTSTATPRKHFFRIPSIGSSSSATGPSFTGWFNKLTSPSVHTKTTSKPWWNFWSENTDKQTLGSCVQGKNCMLPDCFCQGDTIPNSIPTENTPQMVYITIDGSAAPRLYRRYRALFGRRTNPNGCAARGTIFATEQGSHSFVLRRLTQLRAEIAMQGIRDVKYVNATRMELEMIAQKRSLAKSGITNSVGWKSPELTSLGDKQFSLLKKHGFEYDATLSMYTQKINQRKPWPFTLDFGFHGKCVIPKCPTKTFAGLWEMPSLPIKDYKHMFECSYVDGCMFNPPTTKDTETFLWDNFLAHYGSNKAPFGIHLRQVWFSHPIYRKNVDGLRKFLDRILNMKDVYLISASDVLKWIKDPTPTAAITKTKPWKCS